jgi:hypothetical protein
VHNRQTLPVGQLLQQLAEVTPGIVSVIVGNRKYVEFIVQRIIELFPPRAPPQQVDQLVARNRMNPCRQRLTGILGMALVVHGQQGLLHQIFHVIRQPREAHPEKTAQMRAQVLQKRMISRCFTAQPAQQQIPQLCFSLVHAALSFYS